MRTFRSTPYFRPAVALIVLGLLTAGVLMAPVNAAHTNAHVKRIATRVVKQNGGIFATFRDGPAGIGDTTFSTIASLSVPKGRYAFSAKVGVFHAGGSTISSSCRLVAGPNFDLAAAHSDPSVFSNRAEQTLSLEVVHRFTGPGTVNLQCKEDVAASNDSFRFAKIVGIRAPTLRNTAFTPASVQRTSMPDGA